VANNGVMALNALAQGKFDLVLMDIQMPVMDGLTTTRIIRALEEGEPVQVPEDLELGKVLGTLAEKLKGKRTPIIAITAHAFQEEVKRSREAGLDLHLTKPLKIKDFRQVIKRFTTPGATGAMGTMVNGEKGGRSTGKKESPKTIDELIEHLASEYGFSKDEIPSFISTAARSISENLTKAQRAAESGDYKTLHISLHSLKGSLGALGLHDAMEMAKESEALARQEKEHPYPEALAKLRSKLSFLLKPDQA